ncbi:MAG: ATP-binding cassette domain-containing protein, partial [Lachnospiraceae bacterium]|nr:ATP-binding cassette domain-containing protein [Lachnospiraceae bacterium]
ARRLIGYLPEHPPLYLSETPLEYLRFVGEAKGLRGEALKKEINKVIEETGIESVENRLISSLSKGFRQRVGIAQALIGNPGIIILDEPTVGLDPIQIIEIRSLIKQLGETHTVIFSSHILSEVQALCSEILIIANGELVAFDTPENLEKAAAEKSSVLLTVLADREETEAVLQASAENGPFSWTALGAENGEVSVRISAENEDARSLLSRLFFDFAEAGLPIIGMTAEKAGLEEVFVELTEEKEAE